MSDNNTLDQFGNEFINNARDRTLKIYEKIKKNEMKSKDKLILSEKINNLSIDEKLVLDEVVYEIVDLVLFNTLNFLEESTQIEFENTNLNELTDGLAGELYSEDGWIHKYSTYKASEK
ncbi:hypothetical protein [Acinetobacter sp. ANC 3832]|uniref:hypothetical protein n=1 Tax=Acinetobacter sp. ANC 3832 TaxID=1977874 RepID=UPI000A32E9DA|nr:hypothetical protein [Acinetobacter sp. ANC 3832]OTG89782.1 hypothetical protein B9T35_16045 [Acinetobacter sp. ANC 3832]